MIMHLKNYQAIKENMTKRNYMIARAQIQLYEQILLFVFIFMFTLSNLIGFFVAMVQLGFECFGKEINHRTERIYITVVNDSDI